MTREELQNLSKIKEDYKILYVDFIKVIILNKITNIDISRFSNNFKRRIFKEFYYFIQKS
jgi:hypothetical protein